MNEKILKTINSTAGRLIFSLLCGFGYFMLVSGWILDMSRGIWLILLYFSPIIICGAAIVIIKLIKQSNENENKNAILRIFWLHIAVILIGAVMFISRFI